MAELALLESSAQTRNALAKAGIKNNEQIWLPTDRANVVTTALLDLVEVFEIGHLGRGDDNEDDERRGRAATAALETDEGEGDEVSDDNHIEEMAQ